MAELATVGEPLNHPFSWSPPFVIVVGPALCRSSEEGHKLDGYPHGAHLKELTTLTSRPFGPTNGAQ